MSSFRETDLTQCTVLYHEQDAWLFVRRNDAQFVSRIPCYSRMISGTKFVRIKHVFLAKFSTSDSIQIISINLNGLFVTELIKLHLVRMAMIDIITSLHITL